MPLINLQTNLKSLKFGKDRPGGGSSNQPYIQKDIPEGDPSNIFNTGGEDFLIRGGLMAPLKAANDVSRLTQMFFDLKSPNGPLFIAKENILSRTSVKTEASFGPSYGAGAVNAGVYTPLSTLGQAASGFSGTHLNLLGLDPTGLSGVGVNNYFDVVKTKNNTPNSEENRLVGLLSNEDPVNVRTYPGGPGSILGIGDTNIKFADQRTGDKNVQSVTNPTQFYTGSFKIAQEVNFSNFLGVSTKENLDEFQTSINSEGQLTRLYGRIGENSTLSKNNPTGTDLKLYQSGIANSTTDREDLPVGIDYNSIQSQGASTLYKSLVETINPESADFDNTYTDKNFFNVYDPNITPGNTWPNNTPLQLSNNSLTYTQEQLINVTPVSKGGTLQDFRKPLLEGKTESTIMSLSPSYNPGDKKTIEQRVNLGNPGTKKNVLKYSTSTEILDKINGSSIYTAAAPTHTGDKNDLVKFSIGIVDNANSANSSFMNFRAFIDSFSDAYSADWGSISYIGRGDKFYNYKGFDRSISMGWTVYAQSKAELIPMYKKLNYLASSLAPSYSSGGFMQGNLARLTVGGYLYNQLGIIKGITYDVPDESPWEIGIDENGNSDSTVKELPFMIKVTGFQFIPIQDFVPAKGQRFISLSNGS